MDHSLLASEALHKTETCLRDLVAKAAANGDYASVVQIASWAQAVNELLAKKPSGHDKCVDLAFTNGNRRVVAQVKTHRKAPEKDGTPAYPQFFRRGDELLRVAWSRRARSEYQHRTSETVLKAVADTLSELGREGRVFSTDEVLPLRDSDGNEVPAYQAYVCIALLKLTGLIEQHGRQGYSITRLDDFTNAVEAVWRKLPAK